jgi:hypothetical protein
MAGGKEAKLAEHHLPTGDGGPQTQPRLGNEVVGALELKSTGLSFLDCSAALDHEVDKGYPAGVKVQLATRSVLGDTGGLQPSSRERAVIPPTTMKLNW